MIITPMLATGAIDLLAIIAVAIIIFVITVFIFQLLWNTTMPQVFGLRQITFWQAFRLLLLTGIIFGGAWVRVVGK
jgi:hypothetical protein